jgi:hypothetical protein
MIYIELLDWYDRIFLFPTFCVIKEKRKWHFEISWIVWSLQISVRFKNRKALEREEKRIKTKRELTQLSLASIINGFITKDRYGFTQTEERQLCDTKFSEFFTFEDYMKEKDTVMMLYKNNKIFTSPIDVQLTISKLLDKK